jgi:hypothetical protein
MKGFFTILFGNWKKIAVITLLTAAAATFFGMAYNRNAVTATIFINIGAVQSDTYGTFENPYNILQAADHFTESVQGWFKNPVLIGTIREQSGTKADFSVRKQEKQNLILTFKAETVEKATSISEMTKRVLEEQINVYNGRNASKFTLSSYDADFVESNLPLWFFAVFGAATGLAAGYFLAAFWNILIREFNIYRRGKA